NVFQMFGPFLGRMGHESQSGISIAWFALAGLAFWLSPRQARWPALVFVLLAAFAFGGGALIRALPGLTLFRLPIRMMQLAAFPLALVAGLATDALLAGPQWTSALRRRCLIWLAAIGLIGTGLVLLGGAVTGEIGRVSTYLSISTLTMLMLLVVLLVRSSLRT